jgi:hypothetical protein
VNPSGGQRKSQKRTGCLVTAKETTSYKTTLFKKQEVAVDAMAFYFEKATGFTCKTGPFGDLTFEHPPETDAEGNTRGFSFASAPYEDFLMMATRMRNA